MDLLSFWSSLAFQLLVGLLLFAFGYCVYFIIFQKELSIFARIIWIVVVISSPIGIIVYLVVHGSNIQKKLFPESGTSV